MKIIKKGKVPAWELKVKCTGSGNGGIGCQAVLMICEGDLYHTYHHCYDGTSDTFTTFTCPCCGHKTDIKDIPRGIKIFKSEKEYLDSKGEWL